MKSRVKFIEGMQFVATSDSGHAVVMDAPVSVGGKNTGTKPSELILMGLGGCTGMDIISILEKKKQKVTAFEMNINGEVAENLPKSFTGIHVEYVITGKDISEEAVKRAIDLSREKYCLVGITLGKSADMTFSYKIIQE